ATVFRDGGGRVSGWGGTTWAVPATDTSSRASTPRPNDRMTLRITTSAHGQARHEHGGEEPPARRRLSPRPGVVVWVRWREEELGGMNCERTAMRIHGLP